VNPDLEEIYGDAHEDVERWSSGGISAVARRDDRFREVDDAASGFDHDHISKMRGSIGSGELSDAACERVSRMTPEAGMQIFHAGPAGGAGQGESSGGIEWFKEPEFAAAAGSGEVGLLLCMCYK